MNCLILTQPLKYNYGCLLQNYSLQKILEVNNISSKTMDVPEKKISVLRIFFSNIKQLIISKRDGTSFATYSHRRFLRESNGYKLINFKEEYLHTTNNLSSKIKFINAANKDKVDIFLVGSDQVWRKEFNQYWKYMFLSFLDKDSSCLRLSYAASFGQDYITYNFFQTKKIKKWLKRFDYLSVREDSGVRICKKNFNINADLVLDPVFLLNKKEFEKIIVNDSEKKFSNLENSLSIFLLGKNNKLSNNFNSSKSRWAYNIRRVELGENVEYPSVGSWLKIMRDSQYVICDSFHACAFCILFNTDFVVINNNKRGVTRIISLLKQFDLINRYADSTSNIEKILDSPINWENVNQKKARLTDYSLNKLLSAISKIA